MNYEELAEKLARENQKLREEVEFLRSLMASYVAKLNPDPPVVEGGDA